MTIIATSNDAGLAVVLLILYIVPTIVALSRKVTNRGSVAIINIFLGWTFVGWVIALAMAVRTSTLTNPES